MPIRTFLFDLGNVLLAFSHEKMYAQMAEVCGVEVGRLRDAIAERHLSSNIERGILAPHEFHAAIEEALAIRVSPRELFNAASDIFWPIPPMESLLHHLRSAGYRMVLISNTCQPHIEHITKHFHVLDFFDERILSYEVGACKPEETIFQIALDRIQCSPGECLYIDDIADYVKTGEQWGLQGHVFRGIEGLAEDLRRREIPWWPAPSAS